MRRICILLVLSSVFVTLLARHDGQGKLTGIAREALREQARQQAESEARSRMEPGQDWRRLMAFVKISPSVADAVLSRHGCRKYAQSGDIFVVSIPLDVLADLAAEPAVGRIEASRPASLTMDSTRLVVNAMPAYEATQRHQAFTGDGVVVGLMDVGFDVTHPTFFDVAGNRFRVGAFWDHLSADTVGSEFPVGRDFVGYDAVLAQQHSVDAGIETHGNHTAGIAAGSGYASPYRGMAYESDLCLVSNAVSADTVFISPADYYKYTSATDALGFKYIFDYADRQGKPCVVSYSEGYTPYLDSEDSLYAAFIDSLVSVPGHILVVSAGNEGLQKTYFEKPIGMGQAGAFINPSAKDAVYKVKTNGPLDIQLHIYEDVSTPALSTVHIISSADGRLDSVLVDTLRLGGDTCVVAVERYASAMTAVTDTFYYVTFSTPERLTRYCQMAIVVDGVDAHAEVYGSSGNSFVSQPIDPQWSAAVRGRNILAPGCFPSVICVGSTSHRYGKENYKGVMTSIATSATDGLCSNYSSTGPAMNGLMKPDVSAPGSNVISAYSRFYLDAKPDDDAFVIGYSDFQQKQHPWAMSTGTSMSTPVVAGAVALWLQANPHLTQQAVKDIISRTSRHPDASADYPNNEYGYGEIDVYRGLLDVLGLNGINSLSTYQPSGVNIFPQDAGLKLVFDQPTEIPLMLQVYSIKGCKVASAVLQPDGKRSASIALPPQPAGVYVVQTSSSDRALCGSQLVRLR